MYANDVHGGHKPGGRLKGQKDHAREFGLSMACGQVHQELRTLAQQTTLELASGVLQAGETITLADRRSATVRDLLPEKHPQAQRATSDIVINGGPTSVNLIRLEALTPKLIERGALQCKGSAGPSGLGADAWRCRCVSLKGPSTKMCQSLASLAILLATEDVSPSAVGPLMACRLIALDKNPRVRPIGVCEAARRIVAKAVLWVVGQDVEHMVSCRNARDCLLDRRQWCMPCNRCTTRIRWKASCWSTQRMLSTV